MKNLSWMLSATGLFVLLAVGSIHAQKPSEPVDQSAADFEKQLAVVAAEISKRAPMMVDSETRLDRVTAGPGKQLNYLNTLITVSADEIDPDAFRDALVPMVKESTCKNDGIHKLFEAGITVNYVYSGKDGVEILRFPLTPEDCGSSP